jgi:hypothetical protein
MLKKLGFCLTCALLPVSAWAELIEFEANDFTVTPAFSNVQTFQFSIELAVELMPGVVYLNPEIIGIEYSVSGLLADNTPSGFPGFALERTIVGEEFYTQGSSMSFEIVASADLTDGLQVSELVGDGLVFLFNAREVDTGRYHPPLFQLNAGGSGSIQNSNNLGGINPSSGEVVDVDFGEEYITELDFDPAALSLTGPIPNLIFENGFETTLLPPPPPPD